VWRPNGEHFCETKTNIDFIVGIPAGSEVFLNGQLDLSSLPDGRYDGLNPGIVQDGHHPPAHRAGLLSATRTVAFDHRFGRVMVEPARVRVGSLRG